MFHCGFLLVSIKTSIVAIGSLLGFVALRGKGFCSRSIFKIAEISVEKYCSVFKCLEKLCLCFCGNSGMWCFFAVFYLWWSARLVFFDFRRRFIRLGSSWLKPNLHSFSMAGFYLSVRYGNEGFWFLFENSF